jgi:hypothetical protein
MAMASYGAPVDLEDFRQRVNATPDGGFCTEPVAWTKFAPARRPGDGFDQGHADLAASVQAVLEEMLLNLCGAFREDADLALRTVRSGYGIAWGERVTTHPLTLSGSPLFARRHSAGAAAAAGRAVLVPTRDTKVDEIDSSQAIVDLISEVEARCVDATLVLTSFHQSPLPLALLLRIAKVPWNGAFVTITRAPFSIYAIEWPMACRSRSAISRWPALLALLPTRREPASPYAAYYLTLAPWSAPSHTWYSIPVPRFQRDGPPPQRLWQS